MSESPATHEDILRRIAKVEERFATAVESMAEELERHREEEHEIRIFIFGGVDGPGLAELVRQHERWISIQRKLIMALVPALILGSAALVWQTIVVAIQVKGN